MPIERIIQGLTEFQDNYFSTHQEFFQLLSLKQAPEVLLITCSDSRIDPNLLTQTKPGELFVIRNIGNMIPPHGTLNSSEGAGIEYAVAALNIKHIIICGHSHCGSMKALLQLNKLNEDMPLVYDWLKHHGEPIRRLLKENHKDCDEAELLRIAIEENVLTQIENLKTYPVIHLSLGRKPPATQGEECLLRSILALDIFLKSFNSYTATTCYKITRCPKNFFAPVILL
ncbi:carbonic anhydrase [Waterburya agarophytonicola K14]|uniref:Carbonic anhydrase n=2 Tax=Waterburya TaxID=2886915 RepID=A0A964BUA1_9CYAN|nr:carbonic anhydrase [Waterburya agarophytonicola KI4]